MFSNPLVKQVQSISIDLSNEQIPSTSTKNPQLPSSEPPEFHFSYFQANPDEWQALIAVYFQEHPPTNPDDNNDTMPELKAGLSRNFSGWEEDANLWLLAMKAYFAMNPSLYEEKNWILAFLNKMDAGCGKSFAKGWLMKCTNKTIKDKDQTFAKIEANFIGKFIPSDQASKAWHTIIHMQMEDEAFKGDFHKFKSEFELEAAQSGVTDKHILLCQSLVSSLDVNTRSV